MNEMSGRGEDYSEKTLEGVIQSADDPRRRIVEKLRDEGGC